MYLKPGVFVQGEGGNGISVGESWLLPLMDERLTTATKKRGRYQDGQEGDKGTREAF